MTSIVRNFVSAVPGGLYPTKEPGATPRLRRPTLRLRDVQMIPVRTDALRYLKNHMR